MAAERDTSSAAALRRLRRLGWLGGGMVVLLAAGLAALPLILRPGGATARRTAPRPQRALEPRAADAHATERPAAEAPGGTVAPDEAHEVRRHARRDPARGKTPAAPRRTRPAASRPAESSPSPPEPGPRRDEWDRSGPARRAGVTRFGGTPHTEDAVEAGLRWLAAHQDDTGTWDRVHFDRRCPEHDRCSGAAVQRVENDLAPGTTGLALLAFLGAGYTDRAGPYQDTVAAAVRALLERQTESGGFSADSSMAGYNDALATFALAEFAALTGDARVREPLEKAAACLAGSQQALGGWDYARRPETGRNDTSITAWMVQALHACAAAGIDLPPGVLVRAALHFSRAAERDGRVRYADAGSGFELDANLRPSYQHGAGMLAAGLTCEQLLGWRLDAALPLVQRGRLLADLPSAAKARGRDPTQFHNEYYWYYGALAMFQRGGEDWERWNGRLRDALLPLQNREQVEGRRVHAWGSWPAFGPNWGVYGRMGGRVYTTAICTLTLEIYYRHTPAYLTEDVLFGPDDWRAYLSGRPAAERLAAVAPLTQLRVEVGEPVLAHLLQDGERRVALAAAAALAELDSPAGLPLIERVITTVPPWERVPLEAAQQRGRAVLALPATSGQVRVVDERQRLATVDMERCWVGMVVAVHREGRPGSRLRIVQRFTGRTIAVAAWDPGVPPPAPGDRVVESPP